MENNAKKKVMIKIGGAPFTLITDETDTFVTAVEKNVNEKNRNNNSIKYLRPARSRVHLRVCYKKCII